ncbi:MAG TPA: hypothetical protein VGK58_04375 [Lacipirellulaceae bacterium]
MKASTRPQFSKKWWTSQKPAEIRGADLEAALETAEKALADEKKKSDEASIGAACSSLEDVESAVDRTIKKECDKKKHKDLIAVLEKFDGLISSETARLEERTAKLPDGGEEVDEEEADDKLFDRANVCKLLGMMKSTGKPLKFGFGVNPQSPEASQLILSKKGKSERLKKHLKKAGVENRMITFGTAMPDPKDGKTLVLRLEESAKEPPQIVKLARRFLRSDSKLKFRKIKLILPGGQTFEDTEE